MINKPIKVFYLILEIMPIFLFLLMLPTLPSEIPAHYNMSGEITRWGSKYELLFMPIVSLITGLTFHLIIEKDKQKNKKLYYYTAICLLILFDALFIIFLYSALNNIENINDFEFYKIFSLVISLTYIVIGNILPKCQPNKLIGIRTKWTLSNPTIWRKTHRFTGRLFIFVGLLQILLIQIGFELNYLILLLLLSALLVFITLLFSYYLFKTVHETVK